MSIFATFKKSLTNWLEDLTRDPEYTYKGVRILLDNHSWDEGWLSVTQAGDGKPSAPNGERYHVFTNHTGFNLHVSVVPVTEEHLVFGSILKDEALPLYVGPRLDTPATAVISYPEVISTDYWEPPHLVDSVDTGWGYSW